MDPPVPLLYDALEHRSPRLHIPRRGLDAGKNHNWMPATPNGNTPYKHNNTTENNGYGREPGAHVDSIYNRTCFLRYRACVCVSVYVCERVCVCVCVWGTGRRTGCTATDRFRGWSAAAVDDAAGWWRWVEEAGEEREALALPRRSPGPFPRPGREGWCGISEMWRTWSGRSEFWINCTLATGSQL